MCTFNIKIDDAVVEMVRPHFQGDAALRRWVEKQVYRTMRDYAMMLALPKEDRSESIYQQVKALEQDPRGLFKLGGILTPSPYSAEELLDEYVNEKYGV